VGSTDGAAAMVSGKLWFRVPTTIKVDINGDLQKGVYSKDLILYLAGILGADGATYQALEFHGSTIDSLSIDARMTISNMAIEVGAKAGLMKADDKTLEFFRGAKRTPLSVAPDDDAIYSREISIDAALVEPQIAKPHAVDNVCPIGEVAETEVAQGYIGTCTNGRLEDLAIAASVLQGKSICPDSRLVVAPASKDIYLAAMEAGYIQTLVKAGASVVTPGCGPCVGTHNGVPSNGENVISTANRNFKGRMGNSEAFVYLGSPATVAASMIEGKIADPRKYV
jgi:3-isopropylmalate/(R)-2-methylmalate dehydratase large subunit